MSADRSVHDVQLRHYCPADLSSLHQIDAECFEPTFRFSRAALRRFAESSEAFTLIAEECASGANSVHAITGFLIVHLHLSGPDRFAYVVTLDVRTKYRQRGIAAFLMREAERLAQQRGATTLRLHVFVGNGPARTFYGRLRFDVLGRVPDFYAESLDALLLRKKLSAQPDSPESDLEEDVSLSQPQISLRECNKSNDLESQISKSSLPNGASQ